MTFLNSAFLFLLSAVSIPLIIHFLSKRRIKTIEFSSLRFLEQMQKSRMRWLRIKELILLALRMLVIALIVLAFARPTLRGFAGSSKATTSVAIVLDRSASMDAEGETGALFDEAKRIAGRLIDSFDAGDRIAIIPFPGQGEIEIIGPTNPGDKLKERLAAIQLSFQKGNIGGALNESRKILHRSGDINREIYIISDMQAGGFANLPPELLGSASWDGIHIFTVSPKTTGEDNVAVTDVLMPTQLLVPGENFEIEAELVNFGRGRLENVLVGAVVDGERRAQSTVSLPPGQPTRMRFAVKVDIPGHHGGYLEIDHDSFEPDNRRYFSFLIPEKIDLLAVSQTSGQLSPIMLALDRAEAGQIAFTGISASDLLREDLTSYDVILLNDLTTLDASREGAVRRYMESGKGLFVILGRSADSGYWTRFLPSISGINVGTLSGRDGEYLSWDNFDYEHPIFAIYGKGRDDRSVPTPANTGPRIPDLRVYFYRNLNGGRILGLTSNGINLMAESPEKPVLVFSSGFDLASNDLPTHSFFIPLLVRSVEYLGSRNVGEGSSGIIGESMRWRLPENITGGLTLQSPPGTGPAGPGTSENLQPNPEGAVSSVRLTEYGPPGIYSLKTTGSAGQPERQIGLLSFNINSDESSSETISYSELSDRLGANVIAVPPESDMKATVSQARFGRELWKEFLLLALLFLIVESVLGRTSPPRVEGK
jgi:hypothetical protein